MSQSPLYRQLAADLSQGIRSGAFQPGDRLPSVRALCVQRGISPATAFQAYAWLEDRGLVERRARSGFFVRPHLVASSFAVKAAKPMRRATHVAISELVFNLLGSTRDVDVVPIGSAFPDPQWFPFEDLARCGARAMRRLKPFKIMGALTAGDVYLREQLRRRYALHGVALNADEPIITNGALEALNLCLQAVTRPGDVVVVESPTFYAALQTLERLHLKALEVKTDPVQGVDLDALAVLLKRHKVAACWFMPTFQNPLGALMSEEKKRSLVQLLAQNDVPLIEDDVYAELHLVTRRPLPAKAFDKKGLVLHCSSFSKCLAPGYRVGWAAAGIFSKDVERLKMMSSLSTSIPSQLAISEYLSEGLYDRHLRHLRRVLSSQQSEAIAMIRQHFPIGTRVTQPDGGYFLWVQLPKGYDALRVYKMAMEKDISIAPGVLFSADHRFVHHLRLNIGHLFDEKMKTAFATIGRIACASIEV